MLLIRLDTPAVYREAAMSAFADGLACMEVIDAMRRSAPAVVASYEFGERP